MEAHLWEHTCRGTPVIAMSLQECWRLIHPKEKKQSSLYGKQGEGVLKNDGTLRLCTESNRARVLKNDGLCTASNGKGGFKNDGPHRLCTESDREGHWSHEQLEPCRSRTWSAYQWCNTRTNVDQSIEGQMTMMQYKDKWNTKTNVNDAIQGQKSMTQYKDENSDHEDHSIHELNGFHKTSARKECQSYRKKWSRSPFHLWAIRALQD